MALPCNEETCTNRGALGLTLVVGRDVDEGTETDYAHFAFCAYCYPAYYGSGVVTAHEHGHSTTWHVQEDLVSHLVPVGWELLEIDTGERDED